MITKIKHYFKRHVSCAICRFLFSKSDLMLPVEIFINSKRQTMVEIFKTNVEEVSMASIIVEKLHQEFPAYRINFDLNDCDRILRVETRGGVVDIDAIIESAEKHSFKISLIPD